MASKATIKTYFQTGDVPTQSQYYEFFDSIVWLSDGAGQESTLSSAATIVIPAKGNLRKIVFWTDTNQWVKVGDSASGSDYADQELTAGIPYTLDIDKFSIAGQTIHLTGQNLAVINYKYYFD